MYSPKNCWIHANICNILYSILPTVQKTHSTPLGAVSEAPSEVGAAGGSPWCGLWTWPCLARWGRLRCPPAGWRCPRSWWSGPHGTSRHLQACSSPGQRCPWCRCWTSPRFCLVAEKKKMLLWSNILICNAMGRFNISCKYLRKIITYNHFL